jgi:hypothetical protein
MWRQRQRYGGAGTNLGVGHDADSLSADRVGADPIYFGVPRPALVDTNRANDDGHQDGDGHSNCADGDANVALPRCNREHDHRHNHYVGDHPGSRRRGRRSRRVDE